MQTKIRSFVFVNENTYNKVRTIKGHGTQERRTMTATSNWYSLEMRPLLNTLHSIFEINFIKGMIRSNGEKGRETAVNRKKSSSIIIRV